MGDKSNIEWTDATWNPVRGCALVSAGCTNCYAMRVAHRFSGDSQPYAGLTKLTSHGPVWTGAVTLHPELLDLPLRWRRPRRIFVNSMSDLFHEDVPDEFINEVYDRMAAAPQHTFQILTKRAARAHRYFSRLPFLQNVWLGVSVEDQPTAEERIPAIARCPVAVLFISAEPLLGPIRLNQSWLRKFGDIDSIGIEWVIAGGESGPRARPSHPDWFRSLRDQCQVADVPFFFKQWGNWISENEETANKFSPYDESGNELENAIHRWPDGSWSIRVLKKDAGNLLDGRTHLEYPACRG